MWHYPLMRMIVAARAHGLRPIDGPFADFRDEDGFQSAATRSAVRLRRQVGDPSEPDRARQLDLHSGRGRGCAGERILAAMQEAQASGAGAVTLDGRMIDVASVRQAEAIVRKADAIAAALVA